MFLHYVCKQCVPLWYLKQHKGWEPKIWGVVIYLKICTFVVSITTYQKAVTDLYSCDLLENLYLCGIYNNHYEGEETKSTVVICLKICTFVVSITTEWLTRESSCGCDLLENLYLCGIYNNAYWIFHNQSELWFAWKSVPLWYL